VPNVGGRQRLRDLHHARADVVLVSLIAFAPDAFDALLALGKGDALAIVGCGCGRILRRAVQGMKANQ